MWSISRIFTEKRERGAIINSCFEDCLKFAREVIQHNPPDIDNEPKIVISHDKKDIVFFCREKNDWLPCESNFCQH